MLPSDDPDVLRPRVLSGTEAEVCGIHRPIDGSSLEQAQLPPPDCRRLQLWTSSCAMQPGSASAIDDSQQLGKIDFLGAAFRVRCRPKYHCQRRVVPC